MPSNGWFSLSSGKTASRVHAAPAVRGDVPDSSHKQEMSSVFPQDITIKHQRAHNEGEGEKQEVAVKEEVLAGDSKAVTEVLVPDIQPHPDEWQNSAPQEVTSPTSVDPIPLLPITFTDSAPNVETPLHSPRTLVHTSSDISCVSCMGLSPRARRRVVPVADVPEAPAQTQEPNAVSIPTPQPTADMDTQITLGISGDAQASAVGDSTQLAPDAAAGADSDTQPTAVPQARGEQGEQPAFMSKPPRAHRPLWPQIRDTVCAPKADMAGVDGLPMDTIVREALEVACPGCMMGVGGALRKGCRRLAAKLAKVAKSVMPGKHDSHKRRASVDELLRTSEEEVKRRTEEWRRIGGQGAATVNPADFLKVFGLRLKKCTGDGSCMDSSPQGTQGTLLNGRTSLQSNKREYGCSEELCILAHAYGVVIHVFSEDSGLRFEQGPEYVPKQKLYKLPHVVLYFDPKKEHYDCIIAAE